MPWTIHNEALKRQWNFNISRPQEPVPKELPDDWKGTPGQGLPVMEIPFTENFPKCVYMHPNRPHREHRTP